MKVRDLLEQLEFMPEDAEIRFASQPNYPMEYEVDDMFAVVQDKNGKGEILYLSEGEQIGYLPSEVREELGW
jgi:hypothetical protein